MRRSALVLMLAAAALAGCGSDEDDKAATTPAHEGESSAGVIDGEEDILIKTFADLASITDTGKVVGGSSLGDSPFCPKGTFSGGHGNTDNGWLDHTFECPDGTLTIAFDPRNEQERSASGPWEVLNGTGAYAGMKGSGQFEIRFPADPAAMEGRETFTGTVSQ